jgi:AcrR family transcriptional regulator
MSVQKKNIAEIYQFISQNGFDVSMDQIASGIHVTKKTLHNRYKTKLDIEQLVLEYWMALFLDRFIEKKEFTNNTIEQLLLFIFEFEKIVKKEFPFFKKVYSQNVNKGNNETLYFQKMLMQLLEEGQEKGEIFEELNTDHYSKYFLINVLHIFIRNSIGVILCMEEIESDQGSFPSQSFQYLDEIQYLLTPILTKKGSKCLQDINLISLFGLQ